MTPKTESWILIVCSALTAAGMIFLATIFLFMILRIDVKLDWLLSRQPPAAQVAPESKP